MNGLHRSFPAAQDCVLPQGASSSSEHFFGSPDRSFSLFDEFVEVALSHNGQCRKRPERPDTPPEEDVDSQSSLETAKRVDDHVINSDVSSSGQPTAATPQVASPFTFTSPAAFSAAVATSTSSTFSVNVGLRSSDESTTLSPASLQQQRAMLEKFVSLFRRPDNGKIPKPVLKLLPMFEAHSDVMWIERTCDGHLELVYNRPALIARLQQQAVNENTTLSASKKKAEHYSDDLNNYNNNSNNYIVHDAKNAPRNSNSLRTANQALEIARKKMQNFERCLHAVQPKLIVLESTHGGANKRLGFAVPEALFGTVRSELPKRIESANLRKVMREKLAKRARHRYEGRLCVVDEEEDGDNDMNDIANNSNNNNVGSNNNSNNNVSTPRDDVHGYNYANNNNRFL